MGMLKRNLLYFFRALEKLSVSMLPGLGIFFVIKLLDLDHFETDIIAGQILMVGMSFTGISMILLAIQSQYTYLPMAISMGSSRKSAFTAMQLVQHVLVLQWCVLILLACTVMDLEFGAILLGLLWFIWGCLIIGMVFLNLVCAFGTVFGYAAEIITIVVAAVSFLVAIVALIIGTKESLSLSSFLFQPTFFLSAVILDVLAGFAYYKAILKADL